MMDQTQAQTSDVVTGTFLINSIPGIALFDSGASNSFVLSSFGSKLRLKPTTKKDLRVRTASSKVVACEDKYKNVPIEIVGTNCLGDLI